MARKKSKSLAAPPRPAPTPREQASHALEGAFPTRPEAWVVAAWAVVALEALLAMYLGTKQPGAWPIRAYVFGLPAIAALALFVGVIGAITSWRRRPFATAQRTVAFCLLGFAFAVATFHLPFPAQRSGRPSRVPIEPPFEGEWTLAWGGLGDANALLATRPDRRYGMIFVAVENGSTRAEPTDPRSAFAFGRDVLAPCAGRVARAVGELPDSGLAAQDDLGNHVVLEIAEGEFLFLTCLKQGSLEVNAGDQVQRGQKLAKVGFSAASRILPEPHLGMHLQDAPEPIWGQSIPFYLHALELNGEFINRAAPEGRGYFPGHAPSGDRVRATKAPEVAEPR